MDISKQLAAYEVEYHVIQEEVVTSMSSAPTSPKLQSGGSMLKSMELEESNQNLQKQVRELQTQLQRAKTNSCLLEARLKESQTNEIKLERQVTLVTISISTLLFLISNVFPIVYHSYAVAKKTMNY